MGFYSAAYVVEVNDTPEGLSTTKTFLICGGSERPILFWSKGTPPEDLHSYAQGTLLSTSELFPPRGYPRTQSPSDCLVIDNEMLMIDESFDRNDDSSFVMHFVFPPRFIPCRDSEPFETPSNPSVVEREGEQLTATFVVKNGGRAQFWIRRLRPDESIEDFDLTNIFKKPAERATKASMEVNLGVVKFAFGDK